MTMTTENISKQPLLIPAIILEVLNYLPTVELKSSCRIVCKVWYEEASRVLRKRRALKVYLTNYDTLNEYFQSSQSQKEMFNEFHLGVRLQLKDPRIQRFFTQFGPFIRSLDLGKSQWPNASLRKILSENLPNLEELSMQLLTPKSSSGDTTPILLSPSSEQFPNIQYEEKYINPNFNQTYPQCDTYNNHNWNYATPPPLPGDYYAGYGSYKPPPFHSTEQWYSPNVPPMLPPGEWQSTFNCTSYYPGQYNRNYGYPQPNGEWYYSSNFNREWYCDTNTPNTYIEYNRSFSYQYPPYGNYQQNVGYPNPNTGCSPLQNFQYNQGWHSNVDYSYNAPTEQHYWNNSTNYVNNTPRNGCATSYNPIPQKNSVKCQNFTPPLPSPATSETHINTLSKMKTLNFSIDYALRWNQEQQDGIKTFFQDLILGMPNLEKISCTKFPSDILEDNLNQSTERVQSQEFNLLPLLDLISEPNGPPLLHLKYLDIPFRNWTNVHKLGERFPLEVLEWNIHKSLDFKTFHGCLLKLGHTLTKLEINFSHAKKNFVKYLQNELSCFKCLEKLKTLTLVSYNGSLGFILLIPGLEILVLNNAKPDFEILFDRKHFKNRMRFGANPSLHSLNICNSWEVGESNLKSNAIRRIGKAFPSLQNLQVEFIGDDALRAIFISFPKLETLKISNGLFTDGCFIGLSPKCLTSFIRTNKRTGLFTVPVREFPFIGSLKNLKKLDICSKHLTDLSVFYGILQCKNLTSLTVQAYGLTNASLMRIANEMNLVYFKTIYCHQLTIFGANYIKKKMPQAHLCLNEYEGPLADEEANRLFLMGIGYRVTLNRLLT